MDNNESFLDVCEVQVKFLSEGPHGSGWYVWEHEYPEEGYVLFSEEKPTAEDLKMLSESYVEVP